MINLFVAFITSIMPSLFIIIMELHIQMVDIYLFSFLVPATVHKMPDKVIKPDRPLLLQANPALTAMLFLYT